MRRFVKKKKLKKDGDNTTSDERLPLSELSVLRLTSISDFNDRDDISSPESLADLSPIKEDSNIVPKAAKENYNFENCKIVFHWPIILLKLERSSSKKYGNCYTCLDVGPMLVRNADIFKSHPGLQPRMRAVLLEWLIEVCDVFKLHRETYYLAMDYIDRYLHYSKDVPKIKLQLIGISSLLIACKIEEIYPPKIAEFSFVTDGACSENDILSMEISIIKKLQWRFKCVTPNCWLLIYLQLGYSFIRKEKSLDYLYSLYPPELYCLAAQLLDLATLDIKSLNFKPSILAISVLYIVCDEKFPLQISGYTYNDIKDCVMWVQAFWAAVLSKKKSECPNYQVCPLTAPKRVVTDVNHFHQQHNVNLELLEMAQRNVERMMHPSPLSLNLLTPPPSLEKKLANITVLPNDQ